MRDADRFAAWCHLTRGYAQQTTERYLRRVRHYVAWCRARGLRLDRVTRGDVEAYLSEAGAASSGVWNDVRAAVISYHDFRLWVRRSRATNPAREVDRRRSNSPPPRHLAPADVVRVLDEADRHSPTMGLFAALLAYAGLRRDEARLLTWRAFLDPDWIEIDGKGGRTVLVPCHPRVRDRARLVKAEAPWGCEWVIPSPRDPSRPLSRSAVSERWHRITEAAGVDAVPHQMRHSYARRLLDRGHDVATVQQALRHQSLSTTSVYVTSRPDRVARAVADLSYDTDAAEG